MVSEEKLGPGSLTASTVAAFTFERMVRLAAGKVQAYGSDLYHDAAWLNLIIERNKWHVRPGGVTFFWQAGEFSTSVGMDEAYMLDTGTPAYRFRVWVDGSKMMLRIDGGPVTAAEGNDSEER
jgi:hypothetical protein